MRVLFRGGAALRLLPGVLSTPLSDVDAGPPAAADRSVSPAIAGLTLALVFRK